MHADFAWTERPEPKLARGKQPRRVLSTSYSPIMNGFS